jgi:DNA-binding XRE family transcriptional regulator
MDALQLKMARVALKLSVRDAASLANVSHDTITRIEAGHALKESTILKVRRALEQAGVIFIEENGAGAGVRLQKKSGR